MCALAYYLEREGIMTTGISLVRENAEALAPPRSLWVSFPLGRPLGVPADTEFQHRVIAAALDLLEREKAPVLEDFPLDAPSVDFDQAPACPVAFPTPGTSDDTWQARLAAELTLLKPFYDLGRRRRKRTTVGLSSAGIDVIVDCLGGMLDEDALPPEDFRWFKLAVEDAKAYYTEALTAQPGDHALEVVRDTLWKETELGAALLVFSEWFRAQPKYASFARIMVPRAVTGAASGVEDREEREEDVD